MSANPAPAATLARAWTLLSRNWIIVVPSIAVGAAGAAVATVLARTGWLSWEFFSDLNQTGQSGYVAFLASIVAMALRIVAAVVAIAFTCGMAAGAWTRGTARFADGAQALRRNGFQAFLALVILTLLGLVAAGLFIPTFGLSVLAYMVFMLYAMPGVIVGNRGATEAAVESIALSWRSLGVTVLLVALIAVLAVVGGVLGALVSRVPFLGQLLAWVVMEVVVAYATLVVVGEYLQLLSPTDQAP
jgi:hypothetical protein